MCVISDKPCFKVVDLAKYIIGRGTEDRRYVSNLQLQRLLYYIQREFLRHGRVAFEEELEAWEIGPVVLNAYCIWSGWAGKEICIKYDTKELKFESKEIKKMVDDVINRTRYTSMYRQVGEICKKGRAWDIIYDGGKGNHVIIPKELIKEEG